MPGLRICVLGAGGLGSVIGGWLAESGVSVMLVARAPHAEAIRARGLAIRGIRGDCVVRRNLEAVTTPGEARGEFDALILAVKAKDTESALASAAPLLARTRAALSLQNTLCKEDALAAHLGAERVIGASTTEAGTLVEPGVVQHVGTAPTAFYFGELDGKPSARVAALVDAFNKAGFGAREAADIRGRHGLAEGHALSLFHLGLTLEALGQSEQAIETFNRAAEAFERLGKTESAAIAREHARS